MYDDGGQRLPSFGPFYPLITPAYAGTGGHLEEASKLSAGSASLIMLAQCSSGWPFLTMPNSKCLEIALHFLHGSSKGDVRLGPANVCPGKLRQKEWYLLTLIPSDEFSLEDTRTMFGGHSRTLRKREA
jgi:hypothetical protein